MMLKTYRMIETMEKKMRTCWPFMFVVRVIEICSRFRASKLGASNTSHVLGDHLAIAIVLVTSFLSGVLLGTISVMTKTSTGRQHAHVNQGTKRVCLFLLLSFTRDERVLNQSSSSFAPDPSFYPRSRCAASGTKLPSILHGTNKYEAEVSDHALLLRHTERLPTILDRTIGSGDGKLI